MYYARMIPQGIKRPVASLLLVLGLSTITSGCTSLSYYRQAISGHLELMRLRVPVADALDEQNIEPDLKRKLETVVAARRFASRTLYLPDNESYLSYADLKRRYVVWNVFAAPELSVQAIESCFLFVGCLTYRGYFSQAQAELAAAQFRADGHDVFVAGVAAYSTLGWFDDPILNTMLVWQDERIVRVIFHELAHQLLYVENDTVFNESFATAVAEFGLNRWQLRDGNTQAQKLASNSDREAAFYGLLLDYRRKLKTLYASKQPNARKREQKLAIFAALRDDYEQFKRDWQGYSGYDNWMSQDLNNAKLSSVATYFDHVPAFRNMLINSGDDLQSFYRQVRELAAMSQEVREACLERWRAANAVTC